jgi:hypothetical protein
MTGQPAPAIRLTAKRRGCHFGVEIDGRPIMLTYKIYRYLLVLAASGEQWVSNVMLEPYNPGKARMSLLRLRRQITEGLGAKWPPALNGPIPWLVFEAQRDMGVRLLTGPRAVLVEAELLDVVNPAEEPEIYKLLCLIAGVKNEHSN